MLTNNRDDFYRPRNVKTSFEETSVYGSPRQSFDIIQDGWVSSFDEDGNFLEVSFEASPDNESVLLMGGSASEAELNQHFFPRMSISTRTISSIAPRLSTTLKKPVSNLKNPIKRFSSRRLGQECETSDEEQELPPVSSGKKRRRNKKLAKRLSMMASKVVPKRVSQTQSQSEQHETKETNSNLFKGKESAKKLRKKILRRISKKGPLLRKTKIGRTTSAEGAFPTVPRKDCADVSSMACPADEYGQYGFASVDELVVDSGNNDQRVDELPAASTDETSDTSCGNSDEEAFTPNMVEATILYHDQRVSADWGTTRTLSTNQKKSNEHSDTSHIGRSTSDSFNSMEIQDQLNVFDATSTLSYDSQCKGSRRRSFSACARLHTTSEFADLKISCSNSTGGVVCPLGSRDDSMTPRSSAEQEELITPMSVATPVPIHTPWSNPIKTISIPNEEDKVYESPSKSSKHACLDDAERRNTPISRTPPSDKKGSANKKQFNYRANRKHVMAPTRLDLVDQAPSSPIGDLRKPRRRHSLKRSIKKGMQANPVVATTVALSAVLFFLRFA